MILNADHWACRYIGLPWIRGEFECWHFCARIWADRFGITVPIDIGDLTGPRAGRRALQGHTERGHWSATEDPREGDAVLMARGTRPCHVGVYMAPQAVLHAVEGPGGIFTPFHRLELIGYSVVGLYRRVT